MTTTATFTKAIRVSRSDTGCYEFTGRQMFFDDVIAYRGTRFDWEVIEPLTGWGDWSHAIRVNYGPEQVYFFAR